MVVFLLSASLCQVPDFQFNLTFESAVIYNEYRKSGGNEMSIGNFVVNPKAKFGYDLFSLSVDYVPEECVLDFGKRTNGHNSHVFRADGHLARPTMIVAAESHTSNFSAKIGGFEVIRPISLSQSLYYLSQPLTHLHLISYGTGVYSKYQSDFFSLDLSIIDGDWQLGQPSLYSRWDSRANSYPTYGGNFRLHCAFLRGGASAVIGDVGSNKGQKRRQSHGIGFIGIQHSCLQLQCYVAYYVRNPIDQDYGDHVPAVETWGYGVDTKLQFDTFAISASVWQLTTNSAFDDGEIWLNGNRESWGFNVSARWDFYRSLYASAFFSQIYSATNSFVYPRAATLIGIAIGIDI